MDTNWPAVMVKNIHIVSQRILLMLQLNIVCLLHFITVCL